MNAFKLGFIKKAQSVGYAPEVAQELFKLAGAGDLLKNLANPNDWQNQATQELTQRRNDAITQGAEMGAPIGRNVTLATLLAGGGLGNLAGRLAGGETEEIKAKRRRLGTMIGGVLGAGVGGTYGGALAGGVGSDLGFSNGAVALGDSVKSFFGL